MTLYDIDARIAACLSTAVDPDTGEIRDELALDELTELQIQRDAKIEGVVLWVKNLRATAAAVRAEKKALDAREKAATARADQLEAWLTEALDGQRFTTARAEVGFRRSTAVEVEDIGLLPEGFTTTKIEVNPDKKAIGAALRAGNTVPGAALVHRMNIQIK